MNFTRFVYKMNGRIFSSVSSGPRVSISIRLYLQFKYLSEPKITVEFVLINILKTILMKLERTRENRSIVPSRVTESEECR